MKKIYTLLATALLTCASTTVNANSWRINSNVKAKADFTSVAQAITSENVVDDDELYLEPGHVEPSDVKLTKKLHLIGPGYWNEQAASNLSYSSSARIQGTIYFTRTGSGSSITGCIFNGANVNASDCDANNITISRCMILGDLSANCGSSYWNIINCYIRGQLELRQGSNVIGCIIIGYGNLIKSYSGGCTISNNLLIGTDTSSSMVTINGDDNLKNTFTNNIIMHSTKVSSIVRLNTGQGIVATNNIICQSETIQGFSDNIYSPYKLEDLFKMTGNEEEMYELKENSPAKGKGTHGADCGAYGGERPYVKGGYPQFIPVIYDVTVPNHPTDGKLPVQLKIRTQND